MWLQLIRSATICIVLTFLHCKTTRFGDLKVKGGGKDVRKPILFYPVTIQELPVDNRHSQGYEEVKWNPIQMLDLQRFIQYTFTLCETDVKFMGNSEQNYSHYWKDLAKAILEAGPHFQW